MPVRTSIDKDRGIVVHEVSSVLTFDAIVHAARALFGNPLFSPSMGILTIFTPDCTSDLSTEDIQKFVELMKAAAQQREGGKSAVVASTDCDYGVSRMVEAMLAFEGREIRSFRHRADAENWLLGADQ